MCVVVSPFFVGYFKTMTTSVIFSLHFVPDYVFNLVISESKYDSYVFGAVLQQLTYIPFYLFIITFL